MWRASSRLRRSLRGSDLARTSRLRVRRFSKQECAHMGVVLLCHSSIAGSIAVQCCITHIWSPGYTANAAIKVFFPQIWRAVFTLKIRVYMLWIHGDFEQNALSCIKLPGFKRYPITTIGVSLDRIITGNYAIITGNSWFRRVCNTASKSINKKAGFWLDATIQLVFGTGYILSIPKHRPTAIN